MSYDINLLIMAEIKIKHFFKENKNLFIDCDVDGFLMEGALPHLLHEIEKLNDEEVQLNA